MRSNKITVWIEIITGIAVVAGLVLLIQEIRLNTQAVNRQAAVDRITALTTPFFESEQLQSADRKIREVDGAGKTREGFKDRYDMTDAEALVWNRHLMQVWMILEADFNYGEPEIALGIAKILLENPDARLFFDNWYEERQASQFRAEVKSIADEMDGAAEG